VHGGSSLRSLEITKPKILQEYACKMREFRDEEIRSIWNDILTNKALEISRIISQFPRERSLVIKYEEIDEKNRDFALNFITQPNRYIDLLREELYSEFLPEDFKSRKENKIIIRISSKLPDLKKNIRDLRSDDLNKFILVDGIVKRATEVIPTIIMAAYKCSYKGDIDLYPQDGTRLIEPFSCNICGKSKEDKIKFTFIPEKSLFTDTQTIEIQEKPELLRGASQPAKLTIHLTDDLCGKFNPGDRVMVSGIFKGKQKMLGPVPTTQFEIFLEGLYVEKESTEYEEVEISEEDEEFIKKFANEPDAYEKLVKSIAPTIYGVEKVKEAIVLQLFGGVRKRFEDGTTVRGEIHILLFGDPGTAKSQLLRYAVNVAPKSIYTSGKGSSAAGLTAAAVKDDFSEGRWTLEAGTLVLADGGLAAIDELDKMDKDDRSAMHEAMEQQTVTIAKAGINATLMSRCAVLGAANPKYGRYDDQESFVVQTDLPPSLISRFDLIFIFVDKPGRYDGDMADYILRVHSDGEKLASGQNPEKSEFKSSIDPELMRKYIVYARKFCNPILSPSAREEIKNYYLSKRKMSGDQAESIAITPRQLEAIIRLSEASARIRLSDRITNEDVERAKNLMDYFLNQTTVINGVPDIDTLMTGVSSKERKAVPKLIDIISELDSSSPDGKGADISRIIKEASRLGMTEADVERMVKLLLTKGEIMEVRTDHYRVVNRR